MAPIHPLAQELPYAAGAALKREREKKEVLPPLILLSYINTYVMTMGFRTNSKESLFVFLHLPLRLPMLIY